MHTCLGRAVSPMLAMHFPGFRVADVEHTDLRSQATRWLLRPRRRQHGIGATVRQTTASDRHQLHLIKISGVRHCHNTAVVPARIARPKDKAEVEGHVLMTPRPPRPRSQPAHQCRHHRAHRGGQVLHSLRFRESSMPKWILHPVLQIEPIAH